jgi:transcriptional regulator GlxA family with amidase domain
MTNLTSQPLKIAILTYERCMGSQIFGILDTLRLAEQVYREVEKGTENQFEIELIKLSDTAVILAGGVHIRANKPKGKYDLLIVPAPEVSPREDWDKRLEKLKPELKYIHTTFAKGTSIATICVGAFLLGEANLLNGRKATTAWIAEHAFAQRFPDCLLNTSEILIEDGNIITTGAMTATFDLAIQLIKQVMGTKTAKATAKIALLQSNRVSQAPFITSSLTINSTPSFTRSIQIWLKERLIEPFDLEKLAQAFHISSRTLLRRIKSETGKSPLSLLQQARVDKAKYLLSNKNWSVAKITEEVGYQDVSSFTQLFVRLVGESPAQYRRRN